MSCITSSDNIEITRGADAVIYLKLRDANDDPYDLTGITDAEATFKGESSDVVKTLGSGVSVDGANVLGKLKIELGEADTALLETGTNKDFSIKTVVGSETKIKRITRALDVIDPSLS